MSTLSAAVLDPMLRADPVGPRITYYDDATGERIELSAVTLANWAAKTGNLLRDELGAGPASRVVMLLPAHWQTAAVLFGVWWIGADVTLGGSAADVALCTAERLDEADATGAAEVAVGHEPPPVVVRRQPQRSQLGDRRRAGGLDAELGVVGGEQSRGVGHRPIIGHWRRSSPVTPARNMTVRIHAGTRSSSRVQVQLAVLNTLCWASGCPCLTARTPVLRGRRLAPAFSFAAAPARAFAPIPREHNQYAHGDQALLRLEQGLWTGPQQE